MIDEGVEFATPIQVIYLSTASTGSTATYVRNVIVAEANSRATIVEIHASTDDCEGRIQNIQTAVDMVKYARSF